MLEIQSLFCLYHFTTTQPTYVYHLCEAWHVINMWKTLTLPHHVTKKEGLGLPNYFNPVTLNALNVPGKESERSRVCVLGESIWPLSTILYCSRELCHTKWDF